MPNKKFLIVIGGPTASGKTSFAIKLARHFQTEIISADSRQFYREMNIGTAKPNQEESSQAIHHFIDNLSIKENYDVGQYEEEALILLDKLFKKNNVVIVVGGSGLYIKALCEGLDEFPEVPHKIRQEIEEVYQIHGISILQKELKKVDPDYYALVDINNPHRLIRALAVYKASGKAFSSFRQQKKISRPFQSIFLQLYWPRQALYRRIDNRVDKMIDQGLLEEVRQLLPYQNHSALQTVGYQEIFDYYDSKINLEEAIDLIKRNSRRYAKRQLTWNRRDGYWKHFLPTEIDLALQYIQHIIEAQFDIRLESPSLHFPPTVLPLPSLPSKSKEPGRWLCAYKNGKIQLLLFKEVINKTICYSHFTQQLDAKDHMSLEFFAHETALQAEEQAAYLIIPPTVEPFFHKYGFQNVTLNHIPRKISNRWAALHHTGGQTVLQRPPLTTNC